MGDSKQKPDVYVPPHRRRYQNKSDGKDFERFEKTLTSDIDTLPREIQGSKEMDISSLPKVECPEMGLTPIVFDDGKEFCENKSSDPGDGKDLKSFTETLPLDYVTLPSETEDTKEMDENTLPNRECPETGPTAFASLDREDFGENDPSNPETIPSDDVELPSNVTNRKQIFMPMDLKPDDPRIYGKWLWFSNGDIFRQDQVWSQLANLILEGLIILQESSTISSWKDTGRKQGVIKCYTRGDLEIIRKAGLAIQSIVNDGVILHYKSNKASGDSKNRSHGDRFISQYMLTACGRLYAQDNLNRWKRVKCSEEIKPSQLELNFPDPGSSVTDLDVMPSREWNKLRYFYPENSSIQAYDGSWGLFCSINSDGLTELDRVWVAAKRLVDDGVLPMVSCETMAGGVFNSNCSGRRTVHCVMNNYSDIFRLVLPIDRLREETNYEFPVYFKLCYLDNGKKMFSSKYLYTDERELYEYLNESWKLVARGETLVGH